LAAGAVAGVTELCILYPLDGTESISHADLHPTHKQTVVKTRFMLQTGKNTSMLQCFQTIVAKEG